MKFVINNVKYHVDMWGEGYPLLLLHGFTGSSDTWAPFESNWENHSEMIAVDIIGHGQSDAPDKLSCYDIEEQAEMLYKLMGKLKIEKADFLGYSMGGRLAITFAVKYPHKVRKLILESTTPGLRIHEEKKARVEQDHRLCEFISEKGISQFIDYWENIPLFASLKNAPSSMQTKTRAQRLQNQSIGLMNSLKGMGTGAQPSWWGKLKDLHIPTLLITGSLDTKFCQLAKSMSYQLPNSDWVVLDECGHAIHVEKPEKFAIIVSEFLSISEEKSLS
ncbi:2-succinyl-6-hydroxy-2,4-cyclohexadiene-1-carboxylate synthase [Cytobacillus purgationiresistens]|uniref:Putative 2-succinyl-6-hydroxy-2,4-cyclohexadiene-1-carboxylate synthase n=1 Tax=Cytobacillus purgationiresistens TaxID=863449 RepID=A0ABU0ARE8_9BACI|nr:2-succinyl-6-hydroxy-2,4-cyclohexadiene-1-carboxylate synthase [Cytobacillus purgationiresistens]MDQ0273834.1 2-succinyl-6-hydroxy-2,4-cyclohexadiene-1-carboxylate synthase [Cytobacillus purgationiresistens]